MPAPNVAPSLDAGLGPAPQGASAHPARLTIPVSAKPDSDPPPPTQPPQQQPAPPADAAIDSAADLPPQAPDAGPIAQPDAGQPLHR
jgi:hypothetical protein